MSNFIKPLGHAASRAEKPFKHTFFQSPRLLVGLNCLDAGQRQGLHEHVHQDKFYLVILHAVTNDGPARLSFITALAPAT